MFTNSRFLHFTLTPAFWEGAARLFCFIKLAFGIGMSRSRLNYIFGPTFHLSGEICFRQTLAYILVYILFATARCSFHHI